MDSPRFVLSFRAEDLVWMLRGRLDALHTWMGVMVAESPETLGRQSGALSSERPREPPCTASSSYRRIVLTCSLGVTSSSVFLVYLMIILSAPLRPLRPSRQTRSPVFGPDTGTERGITEVRLPAFFQRGDGLNKRDEGKQWGKGARRPARTAF
ncbi:hypothetical protein WMY93_031300 [Mugilogobius chulae]|uniref:Uncharacterized protein n=1 Tax=Mugilogobius chulae TaxID=88201 RepID=A0AAW0MFW7_9GOBI